MARKSNKTNHVLNLLAGSGETEAAKETEEEKKKAIAGNVQVIASQNEDEEIAGTVSKLLEEELEEHEEEAFQSEPKAVEAEPVPEEDMEPESMGFLPIEPETVTKDQEPVLEETEPEGVAEVKPEEIREVSPEPAVESEEKPEMAEAAAMPEEVPEPVIEDEGDETDYVFISVMERLVRERVGGYMASFSNCTCSRCVADTVALTLCHLPAKYVVVGRDAETPLMNFYSQHYAGDVTVELMKACTAVNMHPHHGRK